MKISFFLSDDFVRKVEEINQLAEQYHSDNETWTVEMRAKATALVATQEAIDKRLAVLRDLVRNKQSKVVAK